MILFRFFITSLCVSLFLVLGYSQNKTLFEYFVDYGGEVPTIKIDTDYKNLIRHKLKEEYQEANIDFALSEHIISLPGKIRARGNTRKVSCHIPPIKIDFSKSDLDSLGFEKSQDNLKLVLPCRNDNGYQERLKMEHFVYDLYSVVEPYHLESKLVRLEFWWEGKLKENMVGFLIEDEDHYAKRLDARIVTFGRIGSSGFDRNSFLKFCFFQYMIANTDWGVGNKPNLEVVKVPAYQMVNPIAYDFDYSGIINQPYAVPTKNLPIKYVTQRHFYKTKVGEEEAIAMANYYKEIKLEFMAKCDSALYLKEKSRKNMKKFIEAFYKKLESEKSILRTFTKN